MLVIAAVLVGLVATDVADSSSWAPAGSTQRTRWSADVDPTNPHPEHPRPQLVRERWMSLNGLWDYAIKPMDAGLNFPAQPLGKILVPFPLESSLSGVAGKLDKDHRLFYRRTFTIAPVNSGKRVLLHFEAVDWGTKVFLNGASLGDHVGGYEPFSFDITDRLRPADNELVVEVWDPCDEQSVYEPPRGKQVKEPSGIWYTSVSGIWQSVWLEWVPERSIESVTFVPDLVRKKLTITPMVRGEVAAEAHVEIVLHFPDNPDGAPAVEARVPANVSTEIDVPDPIVWSPESPKLYSVDLRYGADRAKSYLAFRTVEVKGDAQGVMRLMLNSQPYFMLGTLDQGWWPDGLYTAPTLSAMLFDLEVTKSLGFNTVRKHVKIEPATWYAACDRIGLLVWQDMPSSGPYIGPSDPDAKRAPMSMKIYESELTAMIRRLSFHPSIVMWVPFNEGWGQFDTARIVQLVQTTDPTRLVNNASGWTDRGVGSVLDVHDYSASLAGHCPKGDGKRATVIGEFGGLGLPIPGHLWRESGWGYRSFKDPITLTDAYVALLDEVRELRYDGLCAAIYTQTTDVEIEINGLMTYDRDVLKMTSSRVRTANDAATAPMLGTRTVTPVVSCAADGAKILWRYTLTAPADGWSASGFDDTSWTEGAGGFGTAETPGAIVGTAWSTNDIWLRRRITIDADAKPTHLLIHHDEDATVCIDGTVIAELAGFTGNYGRIALTEAARALLTPGEHVLAVHCRQTRGGQFVDVGLVRLEQRP